ncbi:MAG: LiaF transmembrane domain-containing protein [Bacteroidia bacterium]
MEDFPQYKNRSGIPLTGLVILAAGILLLLRRMGYPVYGWIFTWPALMIGFGLYIIIRQKFRGFAGAWLVLFGAYFLARHQGWITFSIFSFFWPGVLIIIGLLVLIRPGSRFRRINDYMSSDADGSDVFSTVAIFWGVRKVILSKKFAKGDIVNVFGGTEINFKQADINGTAVLDLVVAFGGVKLIVPPDWDVRVNVVNVFAGTDDKREFHNAPLSKKVLLVNGTAIFGGIDIR